MNDASRLLRYVKGSRLISPKQIMRLSLLPDGIISFTQMHPLEANALLSIPQNADPTDIPEAEERLYPAPIEESARRDVDAMEAIATEADWKEYVLPELRELFDGSMERVKQSLKQLGPAPQVELENHDEGDEADEPEEDDDEDEPKSSHANLALNISTQLAEDWYRAMNQARLVMSQKSLWIDGEGNLHGPLISQIHYEIYAHVQGWLVEYVLSEA